MLWYIKDLIMKWYSVSVCVDVCKEQAEVVCEEQPLGDQKEALLRQIN
jgi:hypothetical protein